MENLGNTLTALGYMREKHSGQYRKGYAYATEKVDYINETEKYIIPLLTTLKNRYPEYGDPAFLVKYHIISLLESIKALL